MKDPSSWRWDLSGPILTAAILTLLLAAFLGIVNWMRNDRRRVVGALEFIRFTAVALLIVTLLQPELVQTISRKEEPVVLALLDQSLSMETYDVREAGKVVTRKQWIELKTNPESSFWTTLKETGETESRAFPSVQEDLNRTDLETPLLEALDRHENLKAVIMVTDGDSNQGDSMKAAAKYKANGIPIYTFSVGGEKALPDISLEQVDVSPSGLLGEQLVISYRLRSDFPEKVTVKLELMEEGVEKPVKTTTRDIDKEDETRGTLFWKPEVEGERKLQLRVSTDDKSQLTRSFEDWQSWIKQSGEAFADNNLKSLRTHIKDTKIRVLVVDSMPRWEYRYLRNALQRDPSVEMKSILFHPSLEMGGGNDYLSRFPATKDALAPYDVVFLGDVGIGGGELTEENVDMIADLVRNFASGLVLIPGFRGRQLTFLESSLKDFLPVVLDEEKTNGVGMRNESNLVLTTLGRDHWLTKLENNEKTNAELWEKRLPGFNWSAGVLKSRPGTKVLAVHSNQRNKSGRIPLLAINQTVGTGKTLFLGTDAAWRWRRGVEDKYHYRFWSQVARWMAAQRHRGEGDGIRVITSPDSPKEGDRVFVMCHVFDSSGLPIRDDNVFGRLKHPSGSIEDLRFTQTKGAEGVFESSFLAREDGDVTIEVYAPDHDREYIAGPGQEKSGIMVKGINPEARGRPTKEDGLREMSRLTGGSFGYWNPRDDKEKDLQAIVDEIAALPDPAPFVEIKRFWANPWWGGFIVFLFAIYWTGRKMAGMM
ncbi:MAG: hypothetical protein CMI30_06105 [Opitutae bacterium]|nr:hypothetical protein [Opitutae bacterium]|tara:strand:- start:9396 stop:11690 length:2295 start_codon:yes stop_codon:yes gene_type:complete